MQLEAQSDKWTEERRQLKEEKEEIRRQLSETKEELNEEKRKDGEWQAKFDVSSLFDHVKLMTI